MKTAFLITISILLSISAFGEVDREKAMACGMWMMKYHLSPQPDSISAKLAEFHQAGLLTDDSKQYPFLGFMSEAFVSHPDKAKEWMMIIEKFPRQEKRICLTAAWLSGIEQIKPFLSEDKRLLKDKNYF
jgi:hypothetical protein